MDDERNKTLFAAVQEDCQWRIEYKFPYIVSNKCRATGWGCTQRNCAPFKMALFFNRPEIKNN